MRAGSRDTEIKRAFDEHFASWSIELPEEDLALRRDGRRFGTGRHVAWVWGRGREGDYLEVFEQHRVCGDARWRVLASGHVEELPGPQMGVVRPYGASPDEIARARAESQRRNQHIYADLRERGLLLPFGEGDPELESQERARSGLPVERSRVAGP